MKAMVLCAGYGTRLGALTREMPKPMLSIGDGPLLAYILANLQRQGFDEVAVNLHFRPEVIRKYFGDGTALGLSLVFSEEPELLGTAGGVKKLASCFGTDQPFLIHYGDILTDQDFRPMLQFHKERGALTTLLIHRRLRSNSVIAVEADGRVTEFLERPDESTRHNHESPWVNSGVCIASPELLQAIPVGRPSDLARDIFPKLISTGRIYAFALSGYRCAIDSEDRLAQAREAVARGTLRFDLSRRPAQEQASAL